MEQYIVVFQLTLALCAAPPGQAVCEPFDAVYQYISAQSCVSARHDYIQYYKNLTNVILREHQTKCEPIVGVPVTYSSVEAARAAGDEQLLEAEDVMRKVMEATN